MASKSFILPILDAIIFCKKKLGHEFPLPLQEENTYVIFYAKCNKCEKYLTLQTFGDKGYSVKLDDYTFYRTDLYCFDQMKFAAELYCTKLKIML